MFGNDRDRLRRYYGAVWRKASAGQPLEPLERLIAEVIREHPQYHAVVDNAEALLGCDYLPEMGETNPFLHMGMHIALREQISGDRPDGIRKVYQRLCQRMGEAHRVEHQMMECLGEMLWAAQRANTAPDESAYLQRLRRLAR